MRGETTAAPTPTAEAFEPGLVARAAAGDPQARARVVEAALPLVRRWARAYAGRGVELDDLVQDGVVGLLRALVRFDADRGVPFGAYARHWVRQAMQQAVAERIRPYRLPTHVLWDLHELKGARERHLQSHGHEARAVELADALGWDAARVDATVRAERPAADANGADLLHDPLAADAYEAVLVRLTAEQVEPLLLRLTEREREIVGLRAEGHSLRDVGRRLGVSGERVRAVEGRSLAKIRAAAMKGVDTSQPMLTPPVDPTGDTDRREDR
jgi:RNA polymerase sigma factor (sigma-70 family)